MAKMVKAVAVKTTKTCPTGKHLMPDGKCMKDSAMKPAAGLGPGMAPPFKRSSGY